MNVGVLVQERVQGFRHLLIIISSSLLYSSPRLPGIAFPEKPFAGNNLAHLALKISEARWRPLPPDVDCPAVHLLLHQALLLGESKRRIRASRLVREIEGILLDRYGDVIRADWKAAQPQSPTLDLTAPAPPAGTTTRPTSTTRTTPASSLDLLLTGVLSSASSSTVRGTDDHAALLPDHATTPDCPPTPVVDQVPPPGISSSRRASASEREFLTAAARRAFCDWGVMELDEDDMGDSDEDSWCEAEDVGGSGRETPCSEEGGDLSEEGEGALGGSRYDYDGPAGVGVGEEGGRVLADEEEGRVDADRGMEGSLGLLGAVVLDEGGIPDEGGIMGGGGGNACASAALGWSRVDRDADLPLYPGPAGGFWGDHFVQPTTTLEEDGNQETLPRDAAPLMSPNLEEREEDGGRLLLTTAGSSETASETGTVKVAIPAGEVESCTGDEPDSVPAPPTSPTRLPPQQFFVRPRTASDLSNRSRSGGRSRSHSGHIFYSTAQSMATPRMVLTPQLGDRVTPQLGHTPQVDYNDYLGGCGEVSEHPSTRTRNDPLPPTGTEQIPAPMGEDHPTPPKFPASPRPASSYCLKKEACIINVSLGSSTESKLGGGNTRTNMPVSLDELAGCTVPTTMPVSLDELAGGCCTEGAGASVEEVAAGAGAAGGYGGGVEDEDTHVVFPHNEAEALWKEKPLGPVLGESGQGACDFQHKPAAESAESDLQADGGSFWLSRLGSKERVVSGRGAGSPAVRTLKAGSSTSTAKGGPPSRVEAAKAVLNRTNGSYLRNYMMRKGLRTSSSGGISQSESSSAGGGPLLLAHSLSAGGPPPSEKNSLGGGTTSSLGSSDHRSIVGSSSTAASSSGDPRTMVVAATSSSTKSAGASKSNSSSSGARVAHLGPRNGTTRNAKASDVLASRNRKRLEALSEGLSRDPLRESHAKILVAGGPPPKRVSHRKLVLGEKNGGADCDHGC